MQPKVSIVVPVYNTERYLTKCIESLINQSLEEIEIIIVNDGSTDNSLIVSEKLSEKYGITLLKGASDKVDEVARKIITKYGKGELNKIAKLNFKNTEKISN